MENSIKYHHKELQKYIRMVEKDETDKEALESVKDHFLATFDMIKLIMISRQERYYGLFLMNFDLKINFSAYYAAGVNIDAFPFRMTVNPLLIGLKTLPEIIYIFCHEIEHIVLNHPVDGILYNPQKNPTISFKLNVAMDTSINDRLTADSNENGFSVISQPNDAITSDYLRENFLIHIKSLQAFDYYFKRISDIDGGKGKGIPFKIVFAENPPCDEIITEKKRKGTICIPCWTESDDPDECAAIIRRFVADVCEGISDSMRGKLPSNQRETLDRLLEPPSITWKQLLKRYIGTIPYGHRKTRLRLNRRQPERYDISGSINDRIIKLVVAIDTSGSMSSEELNRIMVEIFDIIGSRLCEVTIVECDAEIKHMYKVKSVKDVSYDIHGRGGTSFVPVIEYVNSNRYFRDSILIYFTDGEGDYSIPKPMTLRTIWVLYDENCKLSVRNPYGKVVFMRK